MDNILRTPEQKRWAMVQAAAVTFFVLGYSFQYTNIYLWNTFSFSYLLIATILFTGFHFYFVGVRSCVESKLLAAYCAWLLFTRIINGDPLLVEDMSPVFCNVFLITFLPTAILLKPEQRKKMLCIIAAVMGIYFTVVAACGIYSALFSAAVGNPLCPEIDIADFGVGGGRLRIFGLNSNIGGMWFFISFWLLIYLFFAVKNKLWRIPITGGAVIIYLAIVLTYSRNVLLASAACLGLLFAAVVLRLVKNRKSRVKIVCFVLAVCVCIPTVYTVSEKAYQAFSVLAQNVSKSSAAQTSAGDISETGTEAENGVFIENRGFEDTGRLTIYRSIVETIFLEPGKLLTGRLDNDIMQTVNSLLPEELYKNPKFNGYAHPHCAYLYVLLLTGLPGFLLMMAFMFSILKRILMLYFSENPAVGLEHKALALTLCGMMMYNLFETSLFYSFDIRSIGFMLVGGAVIAYSKEFEQ